MSVFLIITYKKLLVICVMSFIILGLGAYKYLISPEITTQSFIKHYVFMTTIEYFSLYVNFSY